MDRRQLFGALWAIATHDPIGSLARQLHREGISPEELSAAAADVRDRIPDEASAESVDKFEAMLAELLDRFPHARPARGCEAPAAAAGRAVAEESAARNRKAR